jgi:DNA repair protein REV1
MKSNGIDLKSSDEVIESPQKRRTSNVSLVAAANHGLSVEAMLRGDKGSTPVGEYHRGSMHIYMAHKISKLGDQGTLEGSDILSNIFKGCYIFVNGHTVPPVNEIKRAVLTHGGKFNQYETSSTTHFVCNHFPQTKLDRLKRGLEKRSIFYVTADWVTESIKTGKRLSESEYRPEGLYIDHKVRRLDTMLGSKGCAAPVPEDHSGAATDSGFMNSSGPVNPSESSHDDAMQTVAEVDNQNYFDGADTTAELFPFDLFGDSEDPDGAAPPLSSDPFDQNPRGSALPSMLHPGVRNNMEMLKSAQSDPNFINRYYESSRLHFIGTWRARLPQIYEECKTKCVAAVAPLESLSVVSGGMEDGKSSSRVVLHVDMDCFFVSALLRSR